MPKVQILLLGRFGCLVCTDNLTIINYSELKESYHHKYSLNKLLFFVCSFNILHCFNTAPSSPSEAY